MNKLEILKSLQNIIDNESKKIDKIDKPKWVNKAFVNAPIMRRTHLGPAKYSISYVQFTSKEGIACGEYPHMSNMFKTDGHWLWQNVRLPTVEEAPRNEWLIPWDTLPTALQNENVLIRYNKFNIMNYKEVALLMDDWEQIEAIMILGNFWYES